MAALASFKLNLPEIPALVAPAAATGVRGVGVDDRLRLPDRLGQHEPERNPVGRSRPLLCNALDDQRASLDRNAIMLRFAALLRPTIVSAAAGLAIAAMTSFALSLLHNLDASIMILIWNLGMAALIAGTASALGRPLLAWVAARIMPALPPRLSGPQ